MFWKLCYLKEIGALKVVTGTEVLVCDLDRGRIDNLVVELGCTGEYSEEEVDEEERG